MHETAQGSLQITLVDLFIQHHLVLSAWEVFSYSDYIIMQKEVVREVREEKGKRRGCRGETEREIG